jgi:hypothetical protein
MTLESQPARESVPVAQEHQQARIMPADEAVL